MNFKKYLVESKVDKISKILGEETEHERIWGKDKTSGFKDLGYTNGWKDTPDIVEKCREKKHQLKSRNVGRCENEYYCDICKFKYTIDSSD